MSGLATFNELLLRLIEESSAVWFHLYLFRFGWLWFIISGLRFVWLVRVNWFCWRWLFFLSLRCCVDARFLIRSWSLFFWLLFGLRRVFVFAFSRNCFICWLFARLTSSSS